MGNGELGRGDLTAEDPSSGSGQAQRGEGTFGGDSGMGNQELGGRGLTALR